MIEIEIMKLIEFELSGMKVYKWTLKEFKQSE